jgi:hypothetical protein
MAGQANGLFGDFLRDTTKFKDDASGFDDGDPVIDGTFTRTHASLGGFGCYRLIRENANPDFTTALHVAGEGDTGGLDLTSLQPVGLKRLQAEFTESQRVAALGISAQMATMLAAVFST